MRRISIFFFFLCLFFACNSTDPVAPVWQEVGLPLLTGVSNVQLAFGGTTPVIAGLQEGTLVVWCAVGETWDDVSSNVLPVAAPDWRLAALPDGSPLLLVSDPDQGYRAVFWQYTNGSWSNHGPLSTGAAYDLVLRVQGGVFASFSDAAHGNQVRVLQHEAGLWIDTGTVSAGDGSSVALGGTEGSLLVAWADWTLSGSPLVAQYAAGWSLLGGGPCATGWSEGVQVAAVPDGSTLVLLRESGLTNRVRVFSGGGWQDAVPAGFPAQGTCALAAAGGNPFLAWITADKALAMVERTSGYWQALPTVTFAGTDDLISLTVDADNHPGVLLETVSGPRLFRYR